jgi:hypothetical protein
MVRILWYRTAQPADSDNRSPDDTPSLLDPVGPWHLDGVLQLPDCSNKLNVTTNHDKANISIAHTLKIMMRVERGDDEYLDSKGNRKVSLRA